MKELMANLVVVKRSGQRVNFNGTKIALAIKSAFDSVYDKYDEEKVNVVYESVLNNIVKNYSDRKTINVEDIQDIIEKELINNKFTDVYEAFNCYRTRRAASREVFSAKQQHKFVKAIERLGFVQKNNQECGFLISDFGQVVSTEFTKAYLLENKYLRSHEEGLIHISDLDLFSSGAVTKACLDLRGIPINTEFIDKIIYILTGVHSETKSECALGSVDVIFTPWLIFIFKGIFKETLNEYLEIEGLSDYIGIEQVNRVIDELNTIDIDINIFKRYALNDVVLKVFNHAYVKYVCKLKRKFNFEFVRLLNSLNNLIYGGQFSMSLSSSKSFESVFIKNNVLFILNGNNRYDNVCVFFRINQEETYDIDIANLVKNDKNIVIINKSIRDLEYFINGEKIYDNVINDEEGSIGRMILSTTTINLARIALKTKSMNQFYSELSNVLEFVRNQMLQRFEFQAAKSKDNFKYLFDYNVLIDSEKLDANQKIRKVIKNGAFNISLSGFVEAIRILNSKEELKVGLDILTHLNKKIKAFNEENKLNFILSSECNDQVNSELLSLDKSIYGVNKLINDYKSYMLIDDIFANIDIENNDDVAMISKYQKQLGFIPNIYVKGKMNDKKVLNIIKCLRDSNVEVYRIVGEKA